MFDFLSIALLTAFTDLGLPTSKCKVISGKTTSPRNATIGIEKDFSLNSLNILLVFSIFVYITPIMNLYYIIKDKLLQ